jgi:hypothetical protein
MEECQQGQRFQELHHWETIRLLRVKATYYRNLLSDSLQNRGFLICFSISFIHLLHRIVLLKLISNYSKHAY